MKKGIRKFLTVFFLGMFMSSAYAQTPTPVLPSDSLALVALYNSTNGAAWHDHTNWLTTPVALWEGVALVGNRVQTLSLPNNNLDGTLPTQFCDLSGLEYIYLQNNLLTGTIPTCIGNDSLINSIDLSNNGLSGTFPSAFATDMPNLADIWITNNKFVDFPDLTAATQLSNLHVENNYFSFEDIVPNTAIANLGYVYAPQRNPNNAVTDIYIHIFDPFSLGIFVGGTGNVYLWQQEAATVSNNTRFSGANTDTLQNARAVMADSGLYINTATNPAAPLLAIQRAGFRVHITDTRLPQFISNFHDSLIYCSDSLALNAFASSGNRVYYQLMSADSGYFNNDSSYFIPSRRGTILLKAYQPGDNTYQPAIAYLHLQVNSHHNVPASFSISNDLPIYEGEELTLSVQEVSGVNYVWQKPDLSTVATNGITVTHATLADAGTYKVFISEGTCRYDTLSIYAYFSSDSNIVIFELITPNGDGDNETFYIRNLDQVPPTEVTVFNVWHQVVYNKDHYNNDWDGGGLPVGTYYYLVKVTEWNKVYKGNLYIKR